MVCLAWSSQNSSTPLLGSAIKWRLWLTYGLWVHLKHWLWSIVELFMHGHPIQHPLSQVLITPMTLMYACWGLIRMLNPSTLPKLTKCQTLRKSGSRIPCIGNDTSKAHDSTVSRYSSMETKEVKYKCSCECTLHVMLSSSFFAVHFGRHECACLATNIYDLDSLTILISQHHLQSLK